MPRRNTFLTIASAIFLSAFLYLGLQLILRTELMLPEKIISMILLSVPFLLVIWLPAVHWNHEGPESVYHQGMQWAAFTSMGLLSFLLLFCVLRDLFFIAMIFWPRFQGNIYGLSGTFAVMSAAASFFLLGTFFARRSPRVLPVDVFMQNIPKGLDGFKIAQISDLHIGYAIKKEFVEKVVATVNGLEADAVVLTGDIGDGEAKLLRESTEPLGRLESKQGTYYVTGNHEYYWGADDWVNELRNLKITPLLGEHRLLEKNGGRLLLAGVADRSAEHFKPGSPVKPEDALKGAPPSDCKILLTHQPSGAPESEAAGFDLQLSGHTHGGQFLPWTLLARFFHPHLAGLGRCGKMWIYVNRGTGYWGPPVRLGSPSEITLLTLRAL